MKKNKIIMIYLTAIILILISYIRGRSVLILGVLAILKIILRKEKKDVSV